MGCLSCIAKNSVLSASTNELVHTADYPAPTVWSVERKVHCDLKLRIQYPFIQISKSLVNMLRGTKQQMRTDSVITFNSTSDSRELPMTIFLFFWVRGLLPHRIKTIGDKSVWEKRPNSSSNHWWTFCVRLQLLNKFLAPCKKISRLCNQRVSQKPQYFH